MEAGGCTEPPEDNMGPDAFYVEEAQATLAHIQELGLSELADRFLSMNPGPQISIPVPQGGKKRGEFINLNFSKNSGGAKVKLQVIFFNNLYKILFYRILWGLPRRTK